MIRFVGVEHVLHEWPEHPCKQHFFAKKTPLRGLVNIFGEALVFEREHHVFIACDQPGFVAETNGYPHYRSLGAKLVIDGIRIGLEPWISQINIG